MPLFILGAERLKARRKANAGGTAEGNPFVPIHVG